MGPHRYQHSGSEPGTAFSAREQNPKKFTQGVTPMTKCTHDTLRDVLDELCVTPIYTAACARCCVSTKSLWRWLRASQREDDPVNFHFVWSDADDWFHSHLKYAMKMSAIAIEATARHHALHGFDEVQMFQGRICWKEDPKLAGLDDETLAMLGYPDRYERNPDGSLIPLTVQRKPSDQLVLKMLSAHFPRTYGDKMEHQHSGMIAVMRIGRDGKMLPNSQAIAKPDDLSDELVVSADSGNVEPTQMQVGLVVREPCKSSAELDALAADLERTATSAIEFREVDGTLTVMTPAVQEPLASPTREQDRPHDAGPLRSGPLPRGYRVC
jgi:hypothetical protein